MDGFLVMRYSGFTNEVKKIINIENLSYNIVNRFLGLCYDKYIY